MVRARSAPSDDHMPASRTEGREDEPARSPAQLGAALEAWLSETRVAYTLGG